MHCSFSVVNNLSPSCVVDSTGGFLVRVVASTVEGCAALTFLDANAFLRCMGKTFSDVRGLRRPVSFGIHSTFRKSSLSTGDCGISGYNP